MVPALIHMDEVQCFVFKEERAVSRNGLLFGEVCIPERQVPWRTYDAVTDEAGKKCNPVTGTFATRCLATTIHFLAITNNQETPVYVCYK